MDNSCLRSCSKKLLGGFFVRWVAEISAHGQIMSEESRSAAQRALERPERGPKSLQQPIEAKDLTNDLFVIS